jgi:type II secretory pathway component GspD/PulD (secretin)
VPIPRGLGMSDLEITMTIWKYGSSRLFGRSAAALAATAGLCVGMAQAEMFVEPETAPNASSAATDFEQFEQLLNRGRIIEAQNLLSRHVRSDNLSVAEMDELDDLLGMLDRRIRSADPIELSLQKAELALAEGDIALMKRQLQPINRGTDASNQQRQIAKGILAEGDLVTEAVRTLADDFIAQAHTDYVDGRFSRAKSTLAVLTRAGIELTDEADAIRTGIFNLELDRGRPFTLVEAAGLFEPGVLTRIADGEQVADSSEAGLILDLFANASFVEDDQPGVIRRDDDVPPLDAPIDLTDNEGQPEDDGGDASEDQPLPDDIIERTLRADAQQKLAQADQAMAESRFPTAMNLYNELLATSRMYFTSDQIQQMERNQIDAQVSMNNPQPGDDLGEFLDQNAAARTELQREFENLLNQSEQRLRSSDISGARERVSSARLVLNGGRELLSEADYEARISQIDDQNSNINSAADAILIAEREARERQIRIDAERDQANAQTQRADKINEQLDRVRSLMSEQKYEECLQVLDQTLFLDPNNPAALLMKDIIRDIVISRGYHLNRKERNFQFSRIVNDNAEAAMPVADIVTYPDDWPRISLNRGEPVSASETPENRRVLASLETQRQDFKFDNSLGDVVNFLEAVSSENFDVDWASLELISIDEQTPVQLNLNNVPFDTVLDRIIDKVSDPLSPAGWAVRDGIVQIASDEALRRNTALVIYDIRDLLIEVPDYEDAPNIDLQSVLQSNQGGGGGQSPFDGDQQDDNEERDRQDSIDQITDIIRSNVDAINWVENGGDTGSIQEFNGSLIIRNTPKNHRAITGLLKQIRSQRAMQINVETRFLLVNQDFFEEIGFDLDVYFGNDNDSVQFARATDPTVTVSDFFEFNPNNTAPDSGVGLQRSVTGAGFNTGGVQGATTQGVAPDSGLSPIGAAQNSLGLTETLGANAGAFASSILSSAPALGVAGQFLDDIQVDFLVKATQADQRSVQLTAPRLTFTNGQIANIIVATQTAFVSQLTPVVATSAVGFTPTISVVSEGVTMEVEGTVSSDRRYVTMNLQTGVSRINGFAEQAVTAVAGGQLVSSEDVQSFIQLPTTTVTRIQTTVTVPDQGTVLLGGQRLVTEFEIETGVPVVSKIPILNRFFTNRIESKEEQTLLVLVKPTILIQSEQEEKNFPGLSDTLVNSLGG